LNEQNRLIDEQKSKIKGLKEQIAGYQSVISNPGPTTSGGFMINHLTSLDTVTRGLATATEQLSVEQERLAQMQGKSASIQQVLEGLEHRRVTLIREEAANQNRAYQSLLLMNGQHDELNRLLGLGNQLLMARQGWLTFHSDFLRLISIKSKPMLLKRAAVIWSYHVLKERLKSVYG
jgi:phage-related minor tail protein